MLGEQSTVGGRMGVQPGDSSCTCLQAGGECSASCTKVGGVERRMGEGRQTAN